MNDFNDNFRSGYATGHDWALNLHPVPRFALGVAVNAGVFYVVGLAFNKLFRR